MVFSAPARAFTLLEVLVVVAILALLMAVLLPALAKAKRAARKVACEANLRALGGGVQNYQTDFGGILPWDGYAEGDRPERYVGPWHEPSLWFNAAATYAGTTAYCDQQDQATPAHPLPREGTKSLFVCPDSQAAVAGPKDDLVTDGYFMLWGRTDAGLLERRPTFLSYGFNTQLDGGLEDRHSTRRIQIKITNIRTPQTTPVLIEKLMRPDEYRPPFASSIGQSEVSWREFTTRHDGGGFLVFLDNHVEFYRQRDLADTRPGTIDYNRPGEITWNPFNIAN
jgi:prepilin-type N-terminal cleavage/methylation domain-containing protein